MQFLPEGAAVIEALPWPDLDHTKEWSLDVQAGFGLNISVLPLKLTGQFYVHLKNEVCPFWSCLSSLQFQIADFQQFLGLCSKI